MPKHNYNCPADQGISLCDFHPESRKKPKKPPFQRLESAKNAGVAKW